MNELHLNNPKFLRHVLTLEQEVERGTIAIELTLPIIVKQGCKKKSKLEILYLMTYDNIRCQNMAWKPSPYDRYKFFSFDCFDIFFLDTIRGIKYVDKKQILYNE
jgi:hypothetical protein